MAKTTRRSYSWTGFDARNRTVSGTVKAADVQSAVRQLVAQGCSVLTLIECEATPTGRTGRKVGGKGKSEAPHASPSRALWALGAALILGALFPMVALAGAVGLGLAYGTVLAWKWAFGRSDALDGLVSLLGAFSTKLGF
jgi:hypothetical protein